MCLIMRARAVKWNEQLESSIELDSIRLELGSLIVVNELSSRYAHLINNPSKFDSFVIRVVRIRLDKEGYICHFTIQKYKN